MLHSANGNGIDSVACSYSADYNAIMLRNLVTAGRVVGTIDDVSVCETGKRE